MPESRPCHSRAPSVIWQKSFRGSAGLQLLELKLSDREKLLCKVPDASAPPTDLSSSRPTPVLALYRRCACLNSGLVSILRCCEPQKLNGGTAACGASTDLEGNLPVAIVWGIPLEYPDSIAGDSTDSGGRTSSGPITYICRMRIR